MNELPARKSKQSRRNSGWTISGIPALLLVAVVSILAVPFVLPGIIWRTVRAAWLCLLVRIHWLPQGKVVLIVYSNSPNWKDYIEQVLLPRLSGKALVLNWSERGRWTTRTKSLAARVFLHWAQVSPHRVRRKLHWYGTDYNPIAIVFVPWWWPRTIRMWQAFRDRKHGKPETLEQQERKLFALIGSAQA